MRTWDNISEEIVKTYIRIFNNLPDNWEITKEKDGGYRWDKPIDTWFSQYDMSKIELTNITLKRIYRTANIFRFMAYDGYKPIIKIIK